ncbi:hypothetical protein J6590_103869 [Homalodisca vitripennis]|nr:hypothetical protein J6590_103869 [Homalodisca vitripennis]
MDISCGEGGGVTIVHGRQIFKTVPAIPSSARTLAASACSAGNPPTAEDVVIQYQQLENDALDEMRNNRNQNEVLQQSMAAMQKIPETKTNQGNPPS